MKRAQISICFAFLIGLLAGILKAEDSAPQNPVPIPQAASVASSIAPAAVVVPPPPSVISSSTTVAQPQEAVSPVISSSSTPVAEPTPVPQPPRIEADDLSQSDTTDGVGSGGFNKSVLAVLVQSNGRVVVGGQFNMYGGVSVGRGIARLDSKASLDKTFTDNTRLTFAKGEFYTLAQQSDGKIVAGGNFVLHGRGSEDWKFFCRFYPDGRLDESFGHILDTGFDNTVAALAIQKDGRILVGGNFSSYAGIKAGGLVRLAPEGQIDQSFASNVGTGIDAKGTVKCITIQTDGKILIVGDFNSFNGKKVDGVLRLNTDGSLDQEFYKTVGSSFFVGFPLLEAEDIENEAGLYLSKALVQPDGHIILGGEFISYDKQQEIYSSRVLRIDAAGNLDLDFIKNTLAHKFTSDVNALLQLANGDVLIGCSTPFSRVSPNGKHDSDFLLIAGRAFGGDINTMSLQPDGKVIVGGRFNAYKGIKVGNIVRLNPDGTMDERFVSGSYK